jgi:hypothetical protein
VDFTLKVASDLDVVTVDDAHHSSVTVEDESCGGMDNALNFTTNGGGAAQVKLALDFRTSA